MSLIDMTQLYADDHKLWIALRYAARPMSRAELWRRCPLRTTTLMPLLRLWQHNKLIIVKNNEVVMANKYKQLRRPPTALEALPGTTPKPKVMRFAQRLWAVLRILKSCDLPTLVMTTEASRATILDYLRQLRRAGYVELTGSVSQCNIRVTMMLDTGRFAPEYQRIIHDGRRFIRIADSNNGAEVLLPCLGHSKRDSSPFFLTGEVNHGC